jgi:SNF2 family DNA or RNA helicase
MKLIQISCGAIYDAKHEAHLIDARPRLAALLEVLEEAGGKVLIFAPLTSVVDLIYAELRRRKVAVEKVTGATSEKARSDIFARFERGSDISYLVADPGTMAHGLTLVAANTIVWYGPTDRPEIYDQANARINRPGQTRNMLIVRLVSTPVEKAIFDRLHAKQTLQGVILKIVEET